LAILENIMIKSMTAYGRGSKLTPAGRWNVEIHSVNRKFLDVSIQLPKDFLVFDIEIRKFLSRELQRGQVSVKVNLVQEDLSNDLVNRQVKHLQMIKQLYEQVANELNLRKDEVHSLSFLLEQRQAFSTSDFEVKEGLYRKELFEVLQDAFIHFRQMKENEGKTLAIEMGKYVESMLSMLSQIETLAPAASLAYKKRLQDRISEVKDLTSQDDDRILREVMLYAEKIDIQEEIIRLKSHIDQFMKLFTSSEKSVGRTMDFLLQEMNREVNTMCSKSDLNELTLLAVKMKGELEKIREQAQNIE
jgi:uncharacterized protein (TIGR00255 family)